MHLPPTFEGLRVSYAQHGEDVLLARAFGAQPTGFWVDVGANDPELDSVTKAFSLRGWRGVNVEPQPALYRRLVALRPQDVNLDVALSSAGGFVELEEVEGAPGLSTVEGGLAERYRAQGRRVTRRRVPCRTLAEVCEAHCVGVTIDFLKVDVEGHEGDVLAGGDFQRFRPRVVMVEVGQGADAWRAQLGRWGYRFAVADGVNDTFVREEDADLAPKLAAPPGLGDHFIRAEHARRVIEGREWDALGPTVQAAARALARAKDASPGLKSALKRALRAVGPRAR